MSLFLQVARIGATIVALVAVACLTVALAPVLVAYIVIANLAEYQMSSTGPATTRTLTVLLPRHPALRANLRSRLHPGAWWVMDVTGDHGRFHGPYATEQDARDARSAAIQP